MKLTITQVVNALPHLDQLTKVGGLKAKTLYNLSKTTKAVAEEVATYEKTRISRLEELSEKDEHGNSKLTDDGSYQLSAENLAVFQEQIKELITQEVEIFCSPIQIKDIEDIVGLTVSIFRSLDWLFIE